MHDIPGIKRCSTVVGKRRLNGLFDFEGAEGGGFTYARSAARIAEARRRFGYFAIFTTSPDFTVAGIVSAYRDKDGVEKQFMELRRYMGLAGRACTRGEGSTGSTTCS